MNESKESCFNTYLENVKKDVLEVKEKYPYLKVTTLPTKIPIVMINVIAVCKETIEITGSAEKDYLGEYSRELVVIVPLTYKFTGCEVYGANWVKKTDVKPKDYHFFENEKFGMKQLCVGTFKSFMHLENVILECVKTAEMLLIGYERIKKRKADHLEIIAYSHGVKGEIEYERNRNKYRTK